MWQELGEIENIHFATLQRWEPQRKGQEARVQDMGSGKFRHPCPPHTYRVPIMGAARIVFNNYSVIKNNP